MKRKTSLKRERFKKLSIQNLKRKPRGTAGNRKEKGRGAEVATVRQNSYGERNCSKLSTKIGRKAWKQAGRKRKISTGGTAVRGKREEGKRKNGRLSSQNRAKADERKQKARGKPESESKREAPVEQLWERNREG